MTFSTRSQSQKCYFNAGVNKRTLFETATYKTKRNKATIFAFDNDYKSVDYKITNGQTLIKIQSNLNLLVQETNVLYMQNHDWLDAQISFIVKNMCSVRYGLFVSCFCLLPATEITSLELRVVDGFLQPRPQKTMDLLTNLSPQPISDIMF